MKAKGIKIKEGPNRIAAIDEIRGIAIIGMLVFHAIFYYEMIFRVHLDFVRLPFVEFVAIAGGGLFIFISGVSCSFAKSNIRRGFVCLGFGLAISAVTLIMWKGFDQRNTFIFFGILHLLGTSMIVFGLTEKAVKRSSEKWNPLISAAIFAGLFAVSYLMVYRDLWYQAVFSLPPVQALYHWNLMYIFGYPNWSAFPPMDFYPILPWMLLFFAGGYVGIWIVKHRLPDWITRIHFRPLVFCGQHTLVIYLIHPIVLYPLILLAKMLLG
jgi:uncharacterized membrane protein